MNYFIKTNRTFTTVRKYAWVVTLLVALGGLWQPRLGLIVIGIMAGLTITAFFTGRYWCGNFCPHGSLFDSIINPISQNKKIPKILKSKSFVSLFFIFFMFNFTRKLINVMRLWGSYQFIDRLGLIFVNTYLIVLIIGGALALLINSRTWCQFCPMGSLQKVSHKLGEYSGITKYTEKKVTIENTSKCHTCGKCSRVCPFQLTPYLEFDEHNQFNNINCIRCSTCVENCPANILSLQVEGNAKRIKENSATDGYENRRRILAIIKNIKDLKDDLKEFEFQFINPRNVQYKAGQFILIKIQDNPLQYRAYSISSNNRDDGTLKVIIKKVENGYGTNLIFKHNIGDEVVLEGPMGNELVVPEGAKKLLFISNGIGVTPFIGLVEESLDRDEIESIIFLNGQRFESDFIYNDQFKMMDLDNDKFKYMPITSRESNDIFLKGYVTDYLDDLDLSEYKVFMCGSKAMIEQSYHKLLFNGVNSKDIYFESEERINLSA